MKQARQAHPDPFQFLLFYRDDASAIAADEAGIDGFVVDFEHERKADRQSGFDTEINSHNIDTLKGLRALSDNHLLCRVDHSATRDRSQIDRVIDAGADEIIVPMVRTFDEAARIVDWCSERVQITIMIETPEAVALASELGQLPIERIYVGLNDLHILRRTRHIFEAMRDGTLDTVRSRITGTQFGYGGLTLPDRGWPLRARHLYNDMARLDCDFTFLRRSFYRDADKLDYAVVLAEMRAEMARARSRDHANEVSDHNQAMAELSQLELSSCD